MPERTLHDRVMHDLKAALSPIQTAAYVLRRPANLEERTVAELAAVIERQTRRLSRMLDEAGEWQRLTDGGIVPRPGEVRPGELLDLALGAIEGAPRVNWSTPDDIPFHGDGYRLQQMLMPLLAFACRRDPDRAPAVEASASPGRLAWTITDAGPPCALESLFVQPDEAPADDGLGLGLLVAQALARCHGGGLRASAAPGGGLRLECEVSALPREDG